MKIFVFIFCLLAIAACDNWAILVAGSHTYSNYRHQADSITLITSSKKMDSPKTRLLPSLMMISLTTLRTLSKEKFSTNQPTLIQVLTCMMVLWSITRNWLSSLECSFMSWKVTNLLFMESAVEEFWNQPKTTMCSFSSQIMELLESLPSHTLTCTPMSWLLLSAKWVVNTTSLCFILKPVSQDQCSPTSQTTLKYTRFQQQIHLNPHGAHTVRLKTLFKANTLDHVWVIYLVLTFCKTARKLIFSAKL